MIQACTLVVVKAQLTFLLFTVKPLTGTSQLLLVCTRVTACTVVVRVVSLSIFLSPVPPDREPYLEEFPQSSLYTIPPGSSVNWTVILTAGSYDDVYWVFNDAPIPLLNTSSSCVNHTDVIATVTKDYIFNYTSRFLATLHICGATIKQMGLYSLVVESRMAKKHPVSFQVDVLQDCKLYNVLQCYLLTLSANRSLTCVC